MQFNFSSLKSNSRRVAIAALALLVAVGAIIADTVTKKREATTTIELIICKPGPNGGWEIFDRAKGPANFIASIAEVGSGKELTTDENWSVVSEKGHRISNVRLSRAAKVSLDPASGLLKLSTDFDATIDGKKIPLHVDLTTENVSTPAGQLTGRKAQINTSARSLDATVVGFTSIKQRDVIEELIFGDGSVRGRATEQAADKKAGNRPTGVVGGGAKAPAELILQIKGQGHIVAK